MLDTKTPLIAEFLKDHQQFSRLLYEISKLVADQNLTQARQRGHELDTVAGPHIAYEEAELYPRLAAFGEKRVTEDRLKGEHRQMCEALRSLLNDETPDNESCQSIQSGFQTALSHAEHCGTLISLMSRLDEKEQADSLAKLLEFRREGQKWTEL